MHSDSEQNSPTKLLLTQTKRSEYKIQTDSSDDSSVYNVQDCYPNKESPVLSKADDENSEKHAPSDFNLMRE